MKNRFIFFFTFFSFIILLNAVAPETIEADDSKPPLPPLRTYGDIVIDNYSSHASKELNIKPVVFPHWWHRAIYTCKVCHTDIGFVMEAGSNKISMAGIMNGKWCGKCHNGKRAFAAVSCNRCHSLGKEVEENRETRKYLSLLPRYGYNSVEPDWMKSFNEGIIKPRTTLDDTVVDLSFDLDIEFRVRDEIPLPNVIFPHKQHTQWLFCNSCHPEIFKMQAGSNPVTMLDIFQGKFCGVCHGKVAFSPQYCSRCHNEKRLKEAYTKHRPLVNREREKVLDKYKVRGKW
jgi:c(7)-type cytochrome triheme protein